MSPLRKIGLAWVFGVVVSWGVIGVFSLAARYPLVGPAATDENIHGAWHVHSKMSHDGFGSKEDIVIAAKRAGHRFVVMTEHNRSFEKEAEYLDGVLVIHGVEWSTPFGHLVQLGGDRETQPPPTTVSEVRNRGGLAYWAHPFQRKNPWTDWRPKEQADGLELYSLDSMSRALLDEPGRTLCALGALPFNRSHGLLNMLQSRQEDMERLVALARQGQQVTLCALDAHGIPPYDFLFPFMSMHLPLSSLPENADDAAEWVKASLARREALCVVDVLGSPQGFHVSRETSTGPLKIGEKMVVHLPPGAEPLARVVVWGDGALEKDGVTVVAKKAGAMVIQVELLSPDCPWGTRWLPWILLSPFRIENNEPI